MIGKKNVWTAFRVAVADASQPFGIILLRIEDGEFDNLVTDESGGAIHRSRIQPLELGVGFRSSDKKAARLVQRVKSIEGQIAAIHDVKSARLGDEHIQNIDVVEPAVRDVDKARNAAAQVKQCMEFYRSFAFSEACPREQ